MTHKITIILICCYCCIFSVYAQSNYTIKGTVTDTTTKTKLEGATIVVLNAKDSIIQKFAYTSKGVFNVSGIKPGKFLLLVTYPDYADYTADFELDAAHPQKNFDDIPMTLRSKLLKDVIIRAKAAAIKIKGDTTEFNASSYATEKNAKVEDLLKQLPGMRINQSGVILFQGEQVQKILLDGEEFFNDDPALITKNIRADMVSKIQVYDDKSETAKKTGLDDGVKVKTINVELREDKKKGVFGKADANAGTDKRYAEQLTINKFNPKEKIAVYGNLSNTGDDSGGIPAARDASAHYDSKWNKDKQSLNATYQLNALDVDRQSNSQSQVNLPDGFNRTNNIKSSHSHRFSQNLNTSFHTALDSTSSLDLNVIGGLSNNNSVDNTNSNTIRGNGILLNSNLNQTNSSSTNKNSYYSINYQKNLKKSGRHISVYSYLSFSESHGDDYLKSDLKYYNDGGLLDTTRSTVTDQYKPWQFGGHSLYTNVSYIEPINKRLSLTVGYGLSTSLYSNRQQSLNKSLSGAYDVPDLLYSNDYSNNSLSNNYSADLRYNNPDVFSVGISNNLGSVVEKRTDNLLDNALIRHYTNWNPHADIWYGLSKSASLRINYNGQSQQPTFNQIQPLKQNTDPLNINIGNPLLKPAFSNQADFSYRVYQATYDRGINFKGSYTLVTNAIVNNRVTDSLGVNTYQYANLTGKQPHNWNLSLEAYGRVFKTDILLDPNINIQQGNSFNYINNKLSINKATSYSADISLTENKSTYAYGMDINGVFTRNQANLAQAGNDTKGYEIRFNLYTKLPFNFFIGSDGQYDYTAPNNVFAQTYSKFLLKAYFGKTFLKEEKLKITLTGNDLLNQNTGFSRTSTSDGFTESRNNVIRRFFLFSITWDFAKFGKTPQTQAQPE